MIQYNVFPGGKKKIVTFSYDDGNADERLVEIFNRYNVKGTFHLNSGKYRNASKEKIEQLRSLYAGHEIACHTVTHGWPYQIPNTSLINEVYADRQRLEEIAAYPVTGMSYPSGNFDDRVVKVMESCGIVYSRTVLAHNDFRLPSDFMRWHPTCHHNNASSSIQRFLSFIDSPWVGPLLYIWGHSHEFKTEDDWGAFEKNIQKIAENPKIWYATNIEIYRYMMAQQSLVISTDEKTLYNPSAISIYVECDKEEIIEIKPGETYHRL